MACKIASTGPINRAGAQHAARRLEDLGELPHDRSKLLVDAGFGQVGTPGSGGSTRGPPEPSAPAARAPRSSPRRSRRVRDR